MVENFACRLEAAARRFPEKAALVWPGGRMSWLELERRARGVACRLDGLRVRRGDRVVVALPNGWRFVVALLGGLKVGATVVPLNPLLTGDEMAVIVDGLTPRLVIREEGWREVPVIGGGATPPPNLPVHAWCDTEDEAWATLTPVAAPALILYTSGSTGRPKGAVLSHAAVAWANRSWAEPIMRLIPDDVVLGVLPFPHSFGLNGGLLAPLLAGATVAIVERFSPEAVIEAVDSMGVTVFPGVATMFRRLLDAPALGGTRLASLRLAVSGAAPCPWDLAREWRERTGVRILRGYGMSELFRPISYLAGDPTEVPDAIGRAAPGVDLLVVDDEGRARPAGETGELLIRTPAAMDAYLDAPDETRAVLAEGWFVTGDLARVSPDGWVSITGRKKEVILRGGYTISPQEVEAALLTHPAIAEAAVIGRPHPVLGEEVIAYVALRQSSVVMASFAIADELIVHCRARLAPYKCPRSVNIVDTLPRSTTGKVLKARLTEL